MTVDEIREKHLILKGKLESTEALLDVMSNEEIARRLKLSVDLVKELREEKDRDKNSK